MKKNIITGFMAVLLTLCSCESWIDVKPTDRLSGKVLFTSTGGFLKALNGVYVELAGTKLYGLNLSAGAIDAMAQYYNLSATSSHAYYYYNNYTYTNANVKTLFDDTWQKAYTMINDCNIIIEECGDGSKYLPGAYYGVVKGEALALRAMLHLDLFRIFGPIYSDATKATKCIPYMTVPDQKVQPLLTAGEICLSIERDLTAALELLEDVDPVITKGVLNSSSALEPNDFRYRQYRLNYYAIKTLLMRTYLCSDRKPEALAIAKEILTAVQVPGQEIFPFVTAADATNGTTPDRVFSTEVIYALYKSNRVDVYNTLFVSTLSATSLFTFAGTYATGRVNNLYDDKNDYRYKSWAQYTANNATTLYNVKFGDISSTTANTIVSRCRYMLPLIRLSEVYLAAAECTPDLAEGTGYLNKVRTSRNCFSLAPANLEALRAAAAVEFKKEVMGEGQLFFYYKRLGMENIPDGSLAEGNKNISLSSYVVPLPDSETSQRLN